MEKRIGRRSANGDFKRPVLLIIGTRPETIKLLPLYLALRKKEIPVLICSTGQHAELLQGALSIFGIRPDFDFKIMLQDQDLFYITQQVLEKAGDLYRKINPSLVVVQGDTTSAMAAALAAFYLKIPVAHVEAGLRTGQIDRPFPEELNRRAIALFSSHHFAPTQNAALNLLEEGVDKKNIYCTGNTVVDALYSIKEQIAEGKIAITPAIGQTIRAQKALGHKILLLTAHRRESFDGGLHRIFRAIKQALQANPKLFVFYPTHPNPSVRKAIEEVGLERMPNIQIILPLSYPDLVSVLDAADCVATDSGGIQEEAMSLNKPVLVLRDETDRPEGISTIVGTNESRILAEIQRILKTEPETRSGPSPFGDGFASQRIALIIQNILEESADGIS